MYTRRARPTVLSSIIVITSLRLLAWQFIEIALPSLIYMICLICIHDEGTTLFLPYSERSLTRRSTSLLHPISSLVLLRLLPNLFQKFSNSSTRTFRQPQPTHHTRQPARPQCRIKRGNRFSPLRRRDEFVDLFCGRRRGEWDVGREVGDEAIDEGWICAEEGRDS